MRHNFFTKGHIQAVQEIDKLIENSIYIGKEGNEDNRDPSLKEFYYCLRGVKIGNEDYKYGQCDVENWKDIKQP